MMTESPHLCPSCKSKDVAKILWGYPASTSSLKESLKKKEIVLGGCLITDHDPKWECNSCYNRWGERYDCDNSRDDSFDYDLGFNLDEVYDQ